MKDMAPSYNYMFPLLFGGFMDMCARPQPCQITSPVTS